MDWHPIQEGSNTPSLFMLQKPGAMRARLDLTLITFSGTMQGCALREITWSPKFPNYEIQGNQHKAYMKEIRIIWSPKGKSQSPEAPGHP